MPSSTLTPSYANLRGSVEGCSPCCRTSDGRAAILPGGAPAGVPVEIATDPKPHTVDDPPPEAWRPLLRIARVAARPLERFLSIQAASGICLLLAAAIALVWANSPWRQSYIDLWSAPLGGRLGPFAFERSLVWWVNDGLMAVFFFVVGLEIRREMHEGELAEVRRAALPIAAALGGMIVPASLYLLVAGHPTTRSGWGAPMATDIAFALGVLALLGQRVPPALRVLLLTVAVVDDLGAILVIAIFYTAKLDPQGILLASAGVAAILLLQRFGARAKALYVVPALVVWAGTYWAGVHPTLAGVAIGLLTPVRAWLGHRGFVWGVRREIERLGSTMEGSSASPDLSGTLKQVDVVRREARSPAEGLIDALHPWVAFLIMPVFALANAGVELGTPADGEASGRVLLGVTAGLLLGKPLGVVGAALVAVRLRIARLPAGLGIRHLLVLGTVAGIGFTMALFIGQLAFADPVLLTAAKLGVLVASGAAALASLVLGRVLLSTTQPPGCARTVEEAEASTEK